MFKFFLVKTPSAPRVSQSFNSGRRRFRGPARLTGKLRFLLKLVTVLLLAGNGPVKPSVKFRLNRASASLIPENTLSVSAVRY